MESNIASPQDYGLKKKTSLSTYNFFRTESVYKTLQTQSVYKTLNHFYMNKLYKELLDVCLAIHDSE